MKWKRNEIIILIEEYNIGVSIPNIALKLNRTNKSIENKLHNLEILRVNLVF